MTSGLRPYPEMKDSGVDWLGAVPEHWEVRRLKTSVQGCFNGTWGGDPNGYDDLICVRVADFDRLRQRVRLEKKTTRAVPLSERKFRLLKKGDLLLEKSGGGELQPVGTVVLYEHEMPAVCSNFVARMPVSDQFNPCFLTYLHSCMYARRVNVRSIKQTTGIQNLDSNSYLNEKVAIPGSVEQDAIARFLNHADRRIRRYISAKEKLIALLEEQRKTIIDQAISGQFDVRTGKPYPSYRDTNIQWLPAAPSQWEVLRFGKVIDLAVGFPFKSEGFSESEEDVRLLRGVNVAPGGLRWEETVRWPASEVDAFSHYRLEVGDIILGMDRPTIGAGVRVAVVGETDVPSLLLQRVARIRPDETRLDPEFAYLLLRGNSFLNYLAPIFTGISVPHLSPDQIRNFSIALPSVNEQRKISRYLRSSTRKTQAAVEAAQRQVALVRDFRARLVADVVTGKTDVREAAAMLPDTGTGVEASADDGPLAESVQDLDEVSVAIAKSAA